MRLSAREYFTEFCRREVLKTYNVSFPHRTHFHITYSFRMEYTRIFSNRMSANLWLQSYSLRKCAGTIPGVHQLPKNPAVTSKIQELGGGSHEARSILRIHICLDTTAKQKNSVAMATCLIPQVSFPQHVSAKIHF